MSTKRINEKYKVICCFEGKMDTLSCKELEKDFDQILSECKSDNMPLVFDLAGVDYIASSFLRLCGKAAQQIGVEKVSIANVTPQVKKVFKIAGLADVLTVS